MEQYYYNRMNKIEQAVYHALYQGFLNIDEEIQIPRLEGEALYNVFFKLRLDHPEIFWATGYKYKYYDDSPNLIFVPEYLFEKAKIKEHQKAMTARVEKIAREAKTFSQWDKEKYIHDFLCESIHYDKLKKPYSHEIIGPLGHGVGVCEGIAKSVKVLCDVLGIWCMIAVCGNNPEKGIKYRHTWNIVKIDGQYYHLDVTFDNTLGNYEKKENQERLLILQADCMVLKKAEKDLAKAEEESKRLADDRKTLTIRKQETESSLIEAKTMFSSLSELSFDTWKEAEKVCTDSADEVQQIGTHIQQALQAQKDADEKVTALQASLETLARTLGAQKEDEVKAKAALESVLEKQKFQSVEELLPFVVTEAALKKTENQITDYRQAVATNQTQLSQAEKDAEGRQPVDAQALSEMCTLQEQTVKTCREAVNMIRNRIANNSEKQTNILSQRSTFEKASKEYSISRRLYTLVKGTTGNGKITLEQYIQAAGFDGIIAAANRRLLPMSGGQYELYRQRDSIGKKINSFLDLEVLDNYTGHRRPVGNLSGGESFKASLSLALGLSDTVSSNLGGIQMDALFVDEGFGTLDRKSMEDAMDALINLSGTNKLVGIISHREELKENIPQQIKVKKLRDGSQITIETDM